MHIPDAAVARGRKRGEGDGAPDGRKWLCGSATTRAPGAGDGAEPPAGRVNRARPERGPFPFPPFPRAPIPRGATPAPRKRKTFRSPGEAAHSMSSCSRWRSSHSAPASNPSHGLSVRGVHWQICANDWTQISYSLSVVTTSRLTAQFLFVPQVGQSHGSSSTFISAVNSGGWTFSTTSRIAWLRASASLAC